MRIVKYIVVLAGLVSLVFSAAFVLFYASIVLLAPMLTSSFTPHIQTVFGVIIRHSYIAFTFVLIIVSSFIWRFKTSIAHQIQSFEHSGFSVVIILIIGVYSTLMLREFWLYRLSFCPGSCYCGNDFKESNPFISRRLIADENGMCFYNQDSFPEKHDSTQFIVNRQGFPNPFDFDSMVVDSVSKAKGKVKKMLFLGDSFLEGVGASSHDKCFAEFYRKAHPNQLMLSTGIGGMDVVQYKLVAQKYIPQLKPDKVVVFFCGWNDVIWINRKPKPYLPIHSFVENVGIIYNYIPSGITPFDTLTLSTDSAYRLYRSRFSLMEKNDFISRMARKTRITTQLYYKINPVQHYSSQFPPDSSATYTNLKAVKNLCDANDIAFQIVFIPTPTMKTYTIADYSEKYKWVFGDLWPLVSFCPKGLITEDDCSTSIDFHFNNKGQEKFAKFIQDLL